MQGILHLDKYLSSSDTWRYELILLIPCSKLLDIDKSAVHCYQRVLQTAGLQENCREQCLSSSTCAVDLLLVRPDK